ncbi:MAG TPA: flagellar basal body P-ring formation chaperone FlgA [Burkholderiaceae bacterium]
MQSRLRLVSSNPAWLALLAVLLFVVTLPAMAQAEPEVTGPTGLDSVLEQQVRRLALDGSHAALPPSSAGSTGTASASASAPRIEVQVGHLDPRLRLAPCQRIEPYLPEGMRPWGKSRIGLRCAQGSVKWNVYLPITVKVWARGLVAANAVAAGSVLGPGDVALADVDLAEDSAPALVDADAVLGRALTRTLRPGQSLRASHLKPRQYFAAGETVNVLAQGPGFSVAGEGQALTNGIEGQPARVRTESGRVLTGLPVGDKRVEIGI